MQVRTGKINDLAFLWEMLFEAFYWDPSARRPAFEDFKRMPQAVKLLDDWGRAGDYAVIAEEEGRPIGAAWFRRWTPEQHSYGYVSPEIPELAIAVDPAWRSRGVGRALLRELIAAARLAGVPGLSLSVSPANRARSLYEHLGFQKVGESGTSWSYLLTRFNHD